MSTLLSMGAGCVLASMSTTVERAEIPLAVPIASSPDAVAIWGWRDRTRAVVVAREGCRAIDVILPPGARLTARKVKVKPADGGGHTLDDPRFEALPRGTDGVARVRVHVPELLVGDEVRLDVSRELAVAGYDWTPGEDGATLEAELRLPKDVAYDKARLADKPGRLWSYEPAGAWARLYVNAGAREDDDTFDLLRPADPEAAASSGTRAPADIIADLSRRRLVPSRRDLDLLPAEAMTIEAAVVTGVLVAETPLSPALVVEGDGLHPIGRVAVTSDSPPRVWAHPEQRWGSDLAVVRHGVRDVPVGTPAGEGPRLDDPADVERTVDLELPADRDPRDSLVPGGGSRSRVHERWTFAGPDDRTRLRLLTLPAGATLDRTEVGGVNSRALTARTKDQVLLVATPGEGPTFEVHYTVPDVPLCGLDTGATVQTDAELARDAHGWWMTSWRGIELGTSRERVIASLNARFNRRSIPEPGLPMGLRGRLSGWDLIAELPDTLRERATVAELPGGDPLWPRKLHRARGTGVVTPFEAALIVRLYALQAKIPATWVLVRSLGEPVGPELCAPTYDAMLVKLDLDGETRWLDPACEACAPFEIRPELLGQPALGEAVTETPAPVPGRFAIAIDGDQVRWTLEGPAALELRTWLRSLPLEGRTQALAERMAGPGATLSSVEGAKDRGVPIVAVAVGAGRLPDPTDALLPAVGEIVAWPGERSVTREGARRFAGIGRGVMTEKAREALVAGLREAEEIEEIEEEGGEVEDLEEGEGG